MAYPKQEVVDELRDLLNWIAVFEEEYDLPVEVYSTLRNKVEQIAHALEKLKVAEDDFELYEQLQELYQSDEDQYEYV